MKTIQTLREWETPNFSIPDIEVGDLIVSNIEKDHQISNPGFWDREIVGKVLRYFYNGFATTYVVAMTSIGETLFEVIENDSIQEDDSWVFVNVVPPHMWKHYHFKYAYTYLDENKNGYFFA